MPSAVSLPSDYLFCTSATLHSFVGKTDARTLLPLSSSQSAVTQYKTAN